VDPNFQIGGDIVCWQISGTPDFSSLLTQGFSTLTVATDNTAKLPISAPGIVQPFSVYYYRFIYNGIPSRTGRFKTLPLPTATVPELKIAFVVCQDYGNGFYTAFAHLAQEQADYVIHLGDYIYETIASNFQGNPARVIPAFPSGSMSVPVDVNDYRHLYKVYRSDPNLQAAHENFAFIQLWDDHEFANDCHQDFHPDNNTAPNTPGTPQPALRQAANQAWSEYGLADVPFTPNGDNWDTSIQVYRKFSFGTVADLIVTDERLYRDGPPCGDSELFQRYFSVGCAAVRDTKRSMLGAVQKQWFLNQVTGSQATWKLWANEVMLMQFKFAGFIYVNLDQWDGYGKEREALLNAIQKAKVRNFVALTGDLHTFLAGYLKPNFDNIFASAMGIELMVGSITSANLAEDILSAVDLPSRPLPAKQFGVPPNLLEPLIRANNPHIQYWNSSTHGYALLTITSTQLACAFKAVTTVRAPTANLVTLRTFTVLAGSTKLSQS
jgi:alkaline phosphatase D